MPDLFESDPKHAPGSRRAPTDLNPAQWKRVREWAEEHCPWIARAALGSLTPLEEYADACLTHFRGTRRMRPDWADSVIQWIRNDERKRLARLVAQGSDSARLALREPIEWRRQFDRVARLVPPAQPSAPSEMIRPRDESAGATIVSLAARRSP